MTAQKTASATAQSAAPVTSSTSNRKTWIKKTPVDVVLEQIGKQEGKVAEMHKELAREERELAKLQKAKQILEAT
jgi:hypothetical protein